MLSPGCCEGDQTCSCPRNSELSSVASRVIFGVVMHPVISRPRQETGLSVTSLEHMMLVTNVRYNSERPDPLWKEYRWKDWAYDKGIIQDKENQPVRNIQIYNPLKISFLPSDTHVYDVAENEYWVDFSVLISNTRTLEVYYKPSYFKYSLRAWSVPELLSNPHCADDVVDKRRGRKTSPEKGNKRNSTSKSKSKSPKKPEKTETAKSESKPKTSRGTDKREKGKGPKEKEKHTSITERPKNLITPALFYLLVDSMTCKQMYFCLSAFSVGDLDKPTNAHILIGKFEWHSPSVAPVVFMLYTTATKGVNITLGPGLHVFRIWHQLPEHFCLQIYSNTLFSIGSKMSIHQVLTSDSVSYEFYGKEISCAFEQLLEMPEGGALHGKAYDHLMSCLQPSKQSKLKTQTLQVFEESLTEMLVESSQFPAEVYQTLQAYQKLFLNPVFGDKTLLNINKDYYKYVEDRRRSIRQKEILLEQELKEKMAQASEKKSKGKSGKSDKQEKKPGSSHKKEVEPSVKSGKTGKQKVEGKVKGKSAGEGVQLRKLLQCKEKSLLLSDYNQSILLLKKMLAKVPQLRQFFPFRYEDDYKLVYQDYIGELQVQEPWVVLVRCVLNLHSSEEVPCSLHIWSPLAEMVLRLINNDTHKDVPLGFVENSVAYLSKNQEGYTLCVYGLADCQTMPWRLRTMGVSQTNLLHVCQGYLCHTTDTQLPEQSQQSLSGFYVPNKDRLIARCLLDISADVTVLLRLQLSNLVALCSFTITDGPGNFVENTTGVGHIILPILKLKGKPDAWMNSSQDSRTSSLVHTYLLEVKLLDNSWPLTPDQTAALIYYKEHLPHIHYDQQSKERSSESSQNSLDDPDYTFFNQVEKPSWTLTVVADLQKVMPVQLRHDTSVFDSLEQLKTQWLDEGTDLNHCQQLRVEFLHKLADEGEEDCSEEAVFHLEAKRTDRLTELYGQRTSTPATKSEARPSSQQSLTASLTTSEGFDSPSGSSVEFRSSSEAALKCSYKSSTSQKLPSSTSSMMMTAVEEEPCATVKVDHTDVMVQQNGIHRALENLRLKSMEQLQALFQETALMRAKLLNDIKIAKEAELNKQKGKSDGPKDRKTSGTSPEQNKGHKSQKDSKKPKSTKGKLK